MGRAGSRGLVAVGRSTRARSSAAALVRSTSTVDAIGFSAARETFAGFDDEMQPIGPGILWSDQRGAAAVLHFGDPDEFRARTGVVLNAACCAAKIAWVTDHEPEAFAAARWILAPRDFVIARLTGSRAHRRDAGVAHRALRARRHARRRGVDRGEAPRRRARRQRGPRVRRRPDPRTRRPRPRARASRSSSAAATGPARSSGTGAREGVPMVSWGTTANVSVPHPGPIGDLPGVAAVSLGALGGYIVEAGLSAAGAALEWLERMTGRPRRGAADRRPPHRRRVRTVWSPSPGSTAPARRGGSPTLTRRSPVSRVRAARASSHGQSSSRSRSTWTGASS